jgi:hypothetical protein
MRLWLNPMVHDPEVLTEFRSRVERQDWAAARRLALALGLLNRSLPEPTETTGEFFQRLADEYAPPHLIAA